MVTFTFEIKDVNEPPVFVNGPYQLDVPENTKVGGSLYKLTVEDPDVDLQFILNPSNISAYIQGDQSNTDIQLLSNTFFVINVLNATRKDSYVFELSVSSYIYP